MAALIAAGIGAAGSLVSGWLGSDAAEEAAAAQARAAREANAEARRQYDLTREDYRPFREAGVSAIDPLLSSYGIGGTDKFNAAYDTFRSSPDFQYAYDEGLRANEGALKASGMGLGGGGALRALTRYGQGMANQNIDRWRGGLQGILGYGQNATAGSANANQRFADTYGANVNRAGDARAASAYGSADAWGNAMRGVGTAAGWGLGQYSQPTQTYRPPSNVPSWYGAS